MALEDQVDSTVSAPVALGHNRPMLEMRNKRTPELNAKFVATNVDMWGIFIRIALDFDQEEEAHRGTSKLVRSCRTLVHRDGINRVLGQTSDRVSDLRQSMLIRTIISIYMIRRNRISSACQR